jgi:hypothetical protein
VPTLNSTSSDAPANRVRLTTAAKAGRAAIALVIATVLAAACQPVPASMPALSTSHVVVPATGLPGAANLVLDGATFDAAAAAACATTPIPQPADFFGGGLAEWAVGALATQGAALDQQRAYAGAALVSGYAAGQDLHQHFGVQALAGPDGPFGDISMLVNADVTIPALDQMVGRFLLLANGDDGAAIASAAGLAPLLAQLHAAAAQDFGAANIPTELRPLMQSLVAATASAATAATSGALGDAGAAHRANAAVSGLLSWAGGYFLGITAATPWPAPSYAC